MKKDGVGKRNYSHMTTTRRTDSAVAIYERVIILLRGRRARQHVSTLVYVSRVPSSPDPCEPKDLFYDPFRVLTHKARFRCAVPLRSLPRDTSLLTQQSKQPNSLQQYVQI